MQRRQRTVVAGVHGLQHVERLARTTLTDDDAVGPHTQGVLHQVTDGDLTAALDVRWARFHRQHVILVELEFLGVLDGDDAFLRRDERRQHVEHRRLARTGATGDDHVQLAHDAGLEEPGGVGVDRAVADQVVDLEGFAGELPDGEEGTLDGEGMDHRVHAGAIGKSGVDHGSRLIDTTTDLGHDLVDDPAEVLRAHERRRVTLDAPRPLHVDGVGTVHHDFGDFVLLQQLVDRAVTQDVVGHVLDELRLVGGRQRRALLLERGQQLLVHATTQVVLAQPLVIEDRTQLFDQVAVDTLTQLVEHGIATADRGGPGVGGVATRLVHFVETLVERHRFGLLGWDSGGWGGVR